MNKEVLELFNEYKIVVYIAKDYSEKLISNMQSICFNRIGEYINCMSWVDVNSMWTPTEKAHPLIGECGSSSKEKEVRLELECKREDLATVVNYINDIHPYEKAEIDVFPILNIDSLLVESEK